jgi:hypothetical protein
MCLSNAEDGVKQRYSDSSWHPLPLLRFHLAEVYMCPVDAPSESEFLALVQTVILQVRERRAHQIFGQRSGFDPIATRPQEIMRVGPVFHG